MVKAINFFVAVAALIAIYFEYVGHALYMILKPLTTILIISILFFIPKTQNVRFRNVILTALFFCLLGDVLLLYDEYFVIGLGSFLIAHLLFTWGFIQLKGFHFNWISFLAVLAVGVAIYLWLMPDLGDFLIPVTLYIVVILFMAWQGMGLFLAENRSVYAWIAIAVILFMFSDTLIAVNKFKSPFHLSGPVILSTYWLSIALIANATYIIASKDNRN